jgi:alpha-tubulin suppressor-like RCC1 family protein
MYCRRVWGASVLAIGVLIPGTVFDLKSKEGEAWVWGSGRNGELGVGEWNNRSLPTNIKNQKFREVRAGKEISAGITAEGRLYTWGKNRNGILGHQPPNINVLLPRVVTSVDKVVQVSCGNEHLCAVTQDGEAFIWGITQLQSSFRQGGRTEVAR